MHADKRIADAAEKLGYGAPVLRDGGHYCVTHPESGAVVVFPATASDHRSVKNAISQLERSCGRKLPKPRGFGKARHVKSGPNYCSQPKTEAEQRASRTFDDIMVSVDEVDARLSELVETMPDGDPSPMVVALRSEVRTLVHRREVLGRAAGRLFRSIPPLDVPGLEAVMSQVPADGYADTSALRERFNG